MKTTTSTRHFARPERRLWGILGGLGPLASAEFLKTIYEQSVAGEEQESPAVILVSDPAFPDRTAMLETNGHQELARLLAVNIRRLLSMEVTDVVICCVTLHAVLPYVPQELRARIVSLLDLIFAAISSSNERQLLVATNGSRSSCLYENHPAWSRVCTQIVLPDAEDQSVLHRLIYDIKHNVLSCSHLHLLASMTDKYGVSSFIAGCTEIHILHRMLLRDPLRAKLRCIDPLYILAERISNHVCVEMSA
jgi:aspartate racemase